jgi:hypothetical protein
LVIVDSPRLEFLRSSHHHGRLGIIISDIDIIILVIVDIPAKELSSNPFADWSLGSTLKLRMTTRTLAVPPRRSVRTELAA